MQVREAKDFLVQQTAEQAQLEGVPLSELEKRMMYFTESGYVPEDPIALNEEFEAEYDTDEYEVKVHGLLRRAYARIKKENPAAVRQWKEAIRDLGKGDHYLLVLWGQSAFWRRLPSEPRPPHDYLKLLGAGLLVTVLLVSVVFAANFLADRYGIHWGGGRRGDLPGTQTQMPVWLQRVLIFVFVGSYFYFAVFPFATKKSPPGLQRIVDKMSRVGRKGSSPR